MIGNLTFGKRNELAGRRGQQLSSHEHVRMDIYSIQSWSLLLDLRILWKTLWKVFRGEAAY